MDRRRSVALILGLLLCLALLGSWFVGIDQEDASPAESAVVAESDTAGRPMAERVQAPRKDASSIGLPKDTWTILTTAEGYQRFDIPDVPITEQESTQELLIPMRTGHALRGRVVDEITHDGIASAIISFRETSVGRYEGNFRLRPSQRSAKDGSFVLHGVPPGSVRLEVSAKNYAAAEIETFVSGKTSPLQIALSKGGTIAGYLAGLDGLTPVAGEASLANLDKNDAEQGHTGPAGEFSFERLSPGRYEVTGRGAGLNGRREFTLSRSERLEGIVLPMTAGHSIRGVISGLRPEERTQTMILVHALSTTTSMTGEANANERGVYEVNGIAPGPVSIEVITMGRGRLVRSSEMPANSDLTVDFEFKTGARLAGRVTRGGKPLAGVAINASVSSEDESYLAQSAITSNNGDYVISDMPEGVYMLTVDSYNTSNVRVAGDTVFDFDVPETQVSGRVLEDGGSVPVVGAIVNVRSAQAASSNNTLAGRSDHFGQFGIRGLQPGDFVLSAYKSGYELYRVPLSYSSPVKDVAINMRRARGVEIKVRDADSNQPISTIFVFEMISSGPGFHLQLQADQNGVSYLPSGMAGSALSVSAWGYGTALVNDWNGQSLDLSLQRVR